MVTINDRSYNNGNDNYSNNNNSSSSSSSSSSNNRNGNYNNNINELNNDKNKNNNGNYGNNTDVHKFYGNKSETVITTARPAFQKASSIIKKSYSSTVDVLKPSTSVRTYFSSIQKNDTTSNLKKDDDWMDCVVNENNSNSSNNSIINSKNYSNNNSNNNSNNSNNNSNQNVHQNRMKRNNDEIEIEKQIRDSKIMASNNTKKVRSSD